MTKNFAHRGYSELYPENTMLAFRKAVEVGCDGIELDVHLTKDGRMVIIHDEEVDRTTNGHGLVKDLTLPELMELDAGQGEKIPTMEEYLDFIAPTGLTTNIELKNSVFWYEGMEEKLIEEIRARKLEDRIIFSSFNHYSILKCKKLAPEIRCGLLTWDWIIDAGAYARKYGIEAWHPEYHNATPEITAEVLGHGVEVNVYTPNLREEMELLISLDVSCIITNNPELLGKVLSERA